MWLADDFDAPDPELEALFYGDTPPKRYLLSLAIRDQGKLPTLDRGIAAWREPSNRFVELIG